MGMFDSIFGSPQADPYAKDAGEWVQGWMPGGRKKARQVLGYWNQMFQNPFGEEFQNAWGQYLDQSNRQFGTQSNNLAMQLAQRMGTSNSSSMPGMLAYLTRMKAQDENDWLRNYATNAKSTAGNNMMQILSGLMGQQMPGLGLASQSYQQSAANQQQMLAALGQALGMAATGGMFSGGGGTATGVSPSGLGGVPRLA